jgi:hypothetical protein
MNSRLATVLAVILLPAASVRAGEARIFLNGLYNVSSIKYSDSRTFTEFTEQGTLDTTYEAKAAFGFEGGLQYSFIKHLGLAASFASVNRDASASYSASLPHPLYLDRPREVSGEVASLEYKETVVHSDVVVGGRSGSLRFGVFAGASFFKVQADVLERIQYDHTYPYDTVQVTGTPLQKAEDSPIGWNAGASLDYALGAHFGLGVQGRWSSAKAEMDTGQGKVKVDAGGLDLAFGVRIYF